MKASKEQQDFIRSAVTEWLSSDRNKLGADMSSLRVCHLWIILIRKLNEISEDRPVGLGSSREWKLSGLDDSNIESVFKSILRERA